MTIEIIDTCASACWLAKLQDSVTHWKVHIFGSHFSIYTATKATSMAAQVAPEIQAEWEWNRCQERTARLKLFGTHYILWGYWTEIAHGVPHRCIQSSGAHSSDSCRQQLVTCEVSSTQYTISSICSHPFCTLSRETLSFTLNIHHFPRKP